MIIDIAKVSLGEETIRSIGRGYIQRFGHWYSWFLHRNHLVATELRDNQLPKTDFGRLVYLAKKLTTLPNHRGALARAIKAAISDALDNSDPDVYLHVLLYNGIDVSRLNRIGQAYTSKHGQQRPNWIKRLVHGHQDFAHSLATSKGHHNPAWNWVTLAKIYESLNSGELSRAIDAEFVNYFGLPAQTVIKRLNLLTYRQHAEIHELQNMVQRGDVTSDNETEISLRLEKALRRTLPKTTELPASSSMMVSIATLPPAVKVGMGVGAVGAGTGIVVGTMVLGGVGLPIIFAVGAGVLVVSGVLVGTNLLVANQSGQAVKIREHDLIKFRAVSETLLTQYVAIFMRLSRDIARIGEISKELTEASASIKSTTEKLSIATSRIEELEQLEINLRDNIKTLGTTIATLASNTDKQAGITIELGEHSKHFEEALKGIQIAKAEFERLRDEYQALLKRQEEGIQRLEQLSANKSGFYYQDKRDDSDEDFDDRENRVRSFESTQRF